MKLTTMTAAVLFAASFFLFSCKEGAKKEPKPVDITELTKD